jgi:hypothetical protein
MMHSFWREIQQREGFKHILTIGCDSHGLQLLVKDILAVPSISVLFQKASQIMVHFNNAPVRLSTLRKIQRRQYKREWSLLAAVITRWGSQYKMLTSLRRSMDALQSYAEKVATEKDQDTDIVNTLLCDSFWMSLARLIKLLQPIDEAIRMPEDSHTDLGKVTIRWKGLEKHLLDAVTDKDFGKDLEVFNCTQLQNRMRRQLTSINWAAYYLHPSKCDVDMTPELQEVVQQVIRKHCPDDPDAAVHDLHLFVERTDLSTIHHVGSMQISRKISG